ncbi:hypothetical protein BC937DRAFT_89874 [Endogone sp. FLAS-F59071]|nr:hypothetical protein BC937DRAFT_89874 [Endogone sp. FLAS-F59071]|eukprot:RUS17516.1 hypothetical protein BC937DRAFT_89874 [Endogone sp. FLAS-F59071]
MQHTRGYDPQHSASVVHEGLEFRRPSAVKSEVKEEEKEGVCWYEEERKRSLMTLKKPTKIASGGSEVRGSVEVKKEENPENIGSTLLREGWRPSNGKAKLMIYDRIKQQRHREAPY